MWFLGSARGHVVRFAVPVASGFVVGALPAIVHALKYHVVPHPPQGPPSTLFDRAEALTDVVVPAFAGLKLGNGGPVLDALPSSVVVLALVAAFGAAVWSRRRGMLALVRGRTDDRQPIDALLLAFALIPLFWLPSRLGAIVPEPRYLVALAPAFSIALVALVPRRPRAEVAGCLALVLMTAALTAAAIDRVADAGGNAPVVNGGAPVRTEPLRALVPELERHGIHAVYADYGSPTSCSSTRATRSRSRPTPRRASRISANACATIPHLRTSPSPACQPTPSSAASVRRVRPTGRSPWKARPRSTTSGRADSLGIRRAASCRRSPARLTRARCGRSRAHTSFACKALARGSSRPVAADSPSRRVNAAQTA